ncbi:DUF6541 family protein [Microbacterium sp. KHB019]|uniref:DUF6541 family protein n=1 Tax=Microbacterium sp. KHB019 TaxID=3129770 RepID=UPI00307AD900
MIGEWVAALPALLVAVALFFVPGGVALAGIGVRRLPLVAFAPPVSAIMLAAVGLIFGFAGVSWNPLTVALALLLLAAVAWLLGVFLGRVRVEHRTFVGRTWVLPVAIAVGMLVTGWRLIAYIGPASAISQTNDAVFHLNAVQYILDTSDASVLHVSGVIGGHSFYPAVWHGFVSLIVLVTGVEIPVAANVVTLVIGAGIWTLGIAWLTRVLTGSGIVAGFAAVFAGALQTFPLLLFQWGVLYPNALSTALVPAAVAAVVSLPRWLLADRTVRHGILGVILVGIAAVSLLLAQPSTAVPWALLCAIWFTFWILRNPVPRALVARLGLVVLAWAVVAVTWRYLASGTSGSHWPPFRSRGEALLDILLNGHMRIPWAVGISVLMVVGLAVAVRRRPLQWFAVGWVAVSVLYFLVATVGRENIRNGVLAVWYADPYRLAALAPIVVVPLAAIGFDALVRLVRQRVPRKHGDDDTRTTLIPLAVAVVGMVVLVLLRPVAMPQFLDATVELHSKYAVEESDYLEPDERELLEDLREYVPPGDRIIANPSTGAGFGYMLAGYDVFPRTWSPPAGKAWNVLAEDLRDAASDPAVCTALHAFGDPEFVLDFGPGEARAGRWLMPGMTDFAGEDGFELVAERGDASLWRITACAP